MIVSKEEIITEALEILGVLGEGEEPNIDMIQSCTRSLDYLTQAWQTEGINIWAVSTLEVPIQTGKKSYVIGPGEEIDTTYRPIQITNGVHRSVNGNDIPLNLWSRQEYWQLSSKDSGGIPLNVYLDRQKTNSVLYVWPVGTGQSDKLILQMQRSLDVNDPDEVDFPAEYFLALAYNLALVIAPKYGLSGQQTQIISQQATKYKEDAEDYNRENTSLFLEPDPYARSYWW